jgi:hypothetical protein
LNQPAEFVKIKIDNLDGLFERRIIGTKGDDTYLCFYPVGKNTGTHSIFEKRAGGQIQVSMPIQSFLHLIFQLGGQGKDKNKIPQAENCINIQIFAADSSAVFNTMEHGCLCRRNQISLGILDGPASVSDKDPVPGRKVLTDFYGFFE